MAARRSKKAADADRPQVYRFFASASECAGYLDGSWQGIAMQGIADWSPADRMQLRLDCVTGSPGGSAELGLRLSAVPARRRWWQRLRLRRSPGSPSSDLFAANMTRLDHKQTIAFTLGDANSNDSSEPASKHQFASDYAQLLSADAGEWELSVQVLEAIRAHCQLSRRDPERGPVIYFSGVVTKTR